MFDVKTVIIFFYLSLSLNNCFGCSKEMSHRDSSFEYRDSSFEYHNIHFG